MINNLSILFSLLVVGYVLVRAVAMDARQPWFDLAPPAGIKPIPDSKGQMAAQRD